jgi:O-antigen/teichoic acid export membrane protein
MLGIGTLLRYMWEKDRGLFKSLSLSRMVDNAKRYIQFPLYSFPSGVINALALQLPVFMLSAIYGLRVVGMFTLAHSVLVLTSSLISTSMGQVYFAEVSKMTRENSRELKNLYLTTTKKLFFIGTPLIIIPSLLAPFLFPVVFGPVWSEAGWYCLPLAIVAIANFVISPTSVLLCYGYNHWGLIWDVSRTLLVLFSFYWIQVLSLPVMIALFIYSIVMAVMYGVNYLLNIWAVDLHLQRGS